MRQGQKTERDKKQGQQTGTSDRDNRQGQQGATDSDKKLDSLLKHIKNKH